MSSPDHDQRVLDAIENQLRIENPWLVNCFSDLGSKTPWIRRAENPAQPVPAQKADNPARPVPAQRATPRGRHRKTDQNRGTLLGQLLLIVIAPALLAVFVAGTAWWLLTVLWK